MDIEETFAFVARCGREDGGYAPSPDPDYPGNSDTSFSDLAAATYAVVLARSAGRELPGEAATRAFFHAHQRPDGAFVNFEGRFDPDSDLAILYNTTQAVVALHALGERPRLSPVAAMARFFESDAFEKLPWYTTSFFPLFYAALDEPFPEAYDRALRKRMIAHQTEDGYLGDHVAASFHMAHYFRLVGAPTPRAAAMVERVLREQQPDGGWHFRPPDWDVHACFDAVFLLRQLGGGAPRCRTAIDRAADWALLCRNDDGGFGHYPGWHSDMDAVYFQMATLMQAGRVPTVARADGALLGWGHLMPVS